MRGRLRRDRGWDDLLRRRDLADHRAEAREKERGDVEGAIGEQAEDLRRDRLGMPEAELPDTPELDEVDDERRIEPLQLVEALLADAEDLHLLAVGEEAVHMLAGKPHDGGVEGAGKAALAGADDE